MTDLIYFRRPTLISNIDILAEALVSCGIFRLVLAPEMGGLRLLDQKSICRLQDLFSSTGIQTPAIHGLFRHKNDLNSESPSEMIATHKQLLNNVAELGVKTYVMHPGLPIKGRTLDQEWTAVKNALEGILPTAEENGIILAVENLPPEYVGNNPNELNALVDTFDSPYLKLCFDSGHAHMCGDATEFLKIMAPNVATMHLHGNDGENDSHQSPGDGTLDWSRLVPELQTCPNLVHMEIESFNREGRSHTELWDLYKRILKIAD